MTLSQKINPVSPDQGEAGLATRVLDKCLNGMILLDDECRVLLWNDWMQTLSSINRQVAVGTELFTLFPDLLGTRLQSAILDALIKGSSALLSNALNKVPFPLYKQGRRVLIKQVIYINPIDICEGKRGCIIQIEDVTSLVRREQLLRDMAQEAQEARNEAESMSRIKSGFIATVSHELRTPLTSILGSLGLLLGGAVGKLPDQAVSLIDIANNNTERLLLLINDILDIEKIESGKMDFNYGLVKVMPFLEQAIEANNGYGESHGVTYCITKLVDDAIVYADKNRLIQVMNNLLSNATKFSSNGDTVEITAERYDDKVRVAVTDHGCGIPEEFRACLFERFTQADNNDQKTHGTGLGLAISKAIIEEHGGSIDFVTEEGTGTTFFFDLSVQES